MSQPTTAIAVTTGTEQVTLINVFQVAPDRQVELVEALETATEKLFLTIPGFLSANLHLGIEGTRVINYAQWASEQQFRDALARPDVREHLSEAAAIADSFEPTLARVSSIHHPHVVYT